MSDAEQLATALALFEAVVELPEHERAALLELRCGNNPPLRAEVEAMLAADAKAGPLATGPGGVLGLVGREVTEQVMPERLGAFEVIAELGRGGMGVVYEGRQHAPDRHVALKTLALDVNERTLGQFRVEAQAMANLLHPGIPQVYALFEHDGRPVLAMELVRGRPLLDHARALSLRERVELLVEIARAIEHAHAHGVVHRDLKPDNVLVTTDGGIKVLDFGLASLGDVAPAQAGTLAYMPPEQLRGEATDARADVYALSVMAWELVCGELPITVDGRDRTALLAAKVAGPTANRRLPATLEHSLRPGLAGDPARRMASVAELRAAWETYLAADAIELLVTAAAREHERFRAALELRDATVVDQRFAAARFGLEQALTLAPRHAGARAALDAVLHEAAAWRLQRGELELATYLCASASVPDEALRERIETARRELDAVELGPARNRRPLRAAIGLLTLAVVFLAVLSALEIEIGYGLFAASSVVLVGLGLWGVWRWRRSAAGWQLGLFLVAPPLTSLLIDAGAWLRGWPPYESHALLMPVLACVSGVVAAFSDRRFALLAGFDAGMWLLSSQMPRSVHALLMMCSCVTMLVIAWIWRDHEHA